MENWRAVPGYDGLYEVSDAGRVRRLKSQYRPSLGPKSLQPVTAKRGGYLTFSLHRSKIRKLFTAHALVMLAFVGPRPNRHDINHLNGMRTDNRLCNLEYCTRSQNELHKKRVLLSGIGSAHYAAKLAEQDIPRIFDMRATGMSHSAIGSEFGVSRRLISKVLAGQAWRHVTLALANANI